MIAGQRVDRAALLAGRRSLRSDPTSSSSGGSFLDRQHSAEIVDQALYEITGFSRTSRIAGARF